MSQPPGPQVWPHPAYRIETERLVLRCYAPGDAAELVRTIQANEQHLAPWMPWARGDGNTLEHYVELLREFRARFDLSHDFIYGVYDPESDEQIGGCGLHARIGPNALEIGYWIAVHRVREGLATELSAALTRVAFEVLDAKRVEIRCDPDNAASAGIPAKLGYSRDGVVRWGQLFDPEEPRDSLVHTMIADDFSASPAAAYDVRAFDVIGRPLLPRDE